jgi:hypothetical protein
MPIFRERYFGNGAKFVGFQWGAQSYYSSEWPHWWRAHYPQSWFGFHGEGMT